MSAADAAGIVDLLERHGIDVWLDGGWGVDCLLEEQTRDHNDLDIVVLDADLDVVRGLLSERGYDEAPGGRPFNFVMRDPAGHEVDVHTIVFDNEGYGHYGDTGEAYPPGSLDARGSIEGRAIRYVTPEAQMGFHAGYEHDANDVHDVMALHRRFGLKVPAQYDGLVE